MNLKLLIPTRIVVDEEVRKVVADGEHGSFCLLPRHVDFLAALLPGLLAFEDANGEERFAAVDEGVLIKRGDEVLVSTRQAIRGMDLEHLRRIASRIAAMQAAEKNIEERLDNLRGSFNQLRQSAITEELIDVVTGFEALSKARRSRLLTRPTPRRLR